MNFLQKEPNYGPLKLPNDGRALLEGRQYFLDEVATAALRDQGIVSPVVVECIARRRNARRIEYKTTDLVTGEVSTDSHIEEACAPMFRAFNVGGRIIKFSLDIEKLVEARAARAKIDNADFTLKVKGIGLNKTVIKVSKVKRDEVSAEQLLASLNL